MTHRLTICLLTLVILASVLFLSAKSVFSYLNRERSHLKEKSKMVELSYYFPDFTALAHHVAVQEALTTSSADYLAYYLKTAQMYPDLKEIYPFEGFFYAKSEQFAPAIKAYENAIKHNPHYLWPYYNLAVLYRRNGDLQKSNEVIQHALGLKPQVTLYVINQSSLYRQIWRHMPEAEQVITANLRQGYEDCLGLLTLNLYDLKEYQALLGVAAQAVKGNFKRKDFFVAYVNRAAQELKRSSDVQGPVPEDPFDFRLF